jgi:hypothetical protein
VPVLAHEDLSVESKGKTLVLVLVPKEELHYSCLPLDFRIPVPFWELHRRESFSFRSKIMSNLKF